VFDYQEPWADRSALQSIFPRPVECMVQLIDATHDGRSPHAYDIEAGCSDLDETAFSNKRPTVRFDFFFEIPGSTSCVK